MNLDSWQAKTPFWVDPIPFVHCEAARGAATTAPPTDTVKPTRQNGKLLGGSLGFGRPDQDPSW